MTPSATPCWAATAPASPVWWGRAVPPRASVAICGAGIAGAWTAYWLARRGVDTVVFDAGAPASGASGRNTGVFMPAFTPMEEPRHLLDVLEREGIPAEYLATGHLALASTREVWDAYTAEAGRRGDRVMTLDRADCEALLGERLSPRFLGGRYHRAAALLHPARLTVGLLEAAESHGATVLAATAVRALQAVHGGELAVVTQRGTVVVSDVVVACGQHTADFIHALRPRMRVTRAYVSTAAMPVPPLGMAIDFGRVFWRPYQDGVVIGVVENNAGDDDFAGDGGDVLAAVFIDRSRPTVDRRWDGIMDACEDGRPLVGRCPGSPGVWIFAGLGGHGFPPAPELGRALAAAIAGDDLASELQRFAPDRFPDLRACHAALA